MDIFHHTHSSNCDGVLCGQVELLSGELNSCQLEGEATARRLKEQLNQLVLCLEGYEKIEKELDDIVLQSAQSVSQI